MSDIAPNDGIPEVTLGWRLRIAMERAGLKAEEMAAQLGVHRGTITRWTHEIGSPPRPIYLRHWAELCQVRYEWLAGEHTPRPIVTVGGAGGTDNRQGTRPDTGEYRRPAMAA